MRTGSGMRASGWVAGALLLLLSVAVYLPGQRSIPVVDRDEARFAQASRQMLESALIETTDPSLHSGGLIVPQVQDRPRLNKPPMIYWLQAAAAGVLTGGDPAGDAIWMYRMPSLVAGVVIVLLTWRLGCSMFDPRAGWLAGVLICVSPVFIWEAHQARADMVLVAATTLTQLCLWNVWHSRRPGAWAVAFWIAMGFGILTKGPITVLVGGLTVVCLLVITRDRTLLTRLRPVLGAVLLAAIVLPWVVLVARHVGWSTYLATVSDEVFGRSVSAKEGHSGPPGYHLVLMLVLFWPGCMLAGLSLMRAIRRGWPRSEPGRFRIFAARHAGRPAELFCLAWLVPAWIVFELVTTKLPHYTMPLYPALALITARGVLAAPSALTGYRTRLMSFGLVAWCIGGWALCGATTWLAWNTGWPVFATIGAGLMWASALIACWMLGVGRVFAAQMAGVLVMGLVSPVVVASLLPARDDIWLTRSVGAALAREDPEGVRPLAASGYHEDSLLFETRGRLVRIEEHEVERWLLEHPSGLLVADRPHGGASHRPVEIASGLVYSYGRRITLYVMVPE